MKTLARRSYPGGAGGYVLAKEPLSEDLSQAKGGGPSTRRRHGQSGGSARAALQWRWQLRGPTRSFCVHGAALACPRLAKNAPLTQFEIGLQELGEEGELQVATFAPSRRPWPPCPIWSASCWPRPRWTKR